MKPILKAEAKSASIYVATNFLIQAGNLLIIPLFWRKLSPQDYGVIAVAELISAIFLSYSNCALDQAINKFYYHWKEEDRRRKLGTLWMASWASVAATGGLTYMVLLALSPAAFPEVPFHPYLELGFASAVLGALRVIPFTVLRIRRKPILFSAYALASFVFGLSISSYFVLYREEGLLGYMHAGVISGIAVFAMGLLVMFHLARPSLDWKCLGESYRFSYPIIASNILSYANSTLDRFMLQHFATMEVLGLYSLGLKFAGAVNGLHDAIKLSYGPFLWKTVHKEEKGKEIIASITPFFLIPILLGGAGLALAIGPLVRLIGEARYFPVIDYVPALSVISMISCLYLYYASGIMLSGKTKLLTLPPLAQMLVLAACGPLLIGSFGSVGVLSMKLAGVLVFLFVSLTFSIRSFAIPHDWYGLAYMFGGAALACAFPYTAYSGPVSNAAVFALLVAWLLYPHRRHAFGLAGRLPIFRKPKD